LEVAILAGDLGQLLLDCGVVGDLLREAEDHEHIADGCLKVADLTVVQVTEKAFRKFGSLINKTGIRWWLLHEWVKDHDIVLLGKFDVWSPG